MKKITVLLAVLMYFAAQAYSQSLPEPKLYKVGDAQVWAIADNIGERDLGIFMAEPEVLKKYVPSGKTETAVMVFVIRSGEDIIVVDTGFGKGLMEGLKKINIKPEEVTLVLITHMHGDHISGLANGENRSFPNAEVKIGKVEYDFWTSDESVEKYPSRKANFDLAKKMADLYGDSVEVFAFGDEVALGITSMDASGHTPGQSAFLLESDGKKMLFIADLVHGEAIQFARPDISSSYDMDPERSAEAREKYFKMAADEKIPVAGAHLTFPGTGEVKKAKEGYTYKRAK